MFFSEIVNVKKDTYNEYVITGFDQIEKYRNPPIKRRVLDNGEYEFCVDFASFGQGKKTSFNE